MPAKLAPHVKATPQVPTCKNTCSSLRQGELVPGRLMHTIVVTSIKTPPSLPRALKPFDLVSKASTSLFLVCTSGGGFFLAQTCIKLSLLLQVAYLFVVVHL